MLKTLQQVMEFMVAQVVVLRDMDYIVQVMVLILGHGPVLLMKNLKKIYQIIIMLLKIL
jgi:hypothetical protein